MYCEFIHALLTLRYCLQLSVNPTDRTYPQSDPDSIQLGCMLEGLSLEYRNSLFIKVCLKPFLNGKAFQLLIF